MRPLARPAVLLRRGSMNRVFAFGLGFALVLGTTGPAFAEKCQFSAASDPHDRDENDPPLKCHKCDEIGDKIKARDTNVWTPDLKYGKPRRVEVKREAKNS